MDDYGDYDTNYYSNDGEDALPVVNDLQLDDPNDDFDAFELLTSPLFDANKSRSDDEGDAGSDYGGYSSEPQQQHHEQQQHSHHHEEPQQRMPPAAAVTPSSAPSSPPFSGYGAQGPTPGQAGFRQQQFGGMTQNPQQQHPQQQMRSHSGTGSNMGSGPGGGMPQQNMMNMNPAAMGNSFGMQQQQQQGGNTMNVNQMGQMPGGGMQGMNPAALQQMQQAMRMQQGNPQMQQQVNAAGMRGGNPMQQGAVGGPGNPMMNAMQGGGMGPGGMGPGGPGVPFAQGGNNPNMSGGNNMQGQMHGQMRPGPGGMQMQGGMNMNPHMNPQQMQQQMQGAAAMQNNISMQQMQNAMNGMSVNRNGSLNHNSALSNRQNGVDGAFHESLPNMHLQRPGSTPASPNSVPSIAQMSASVRNSSSRTGTRTRGAPKPRVDANGKVIANTSSDPGINEAMEKLCESMRRSAMSRNLVKQLSGKSIQRQGSARSLSRSNSGVGMRKQMSGRSLSGNLGGMDDGSGRGTPTRVAPIRRLSNSKHRLHQRAAPGNRGAFRQNSMGSQQGSVGGGGNQTFLQLDDQSLGAL